MILKELGLTKKQWEQLDPNDQRMYTEQLGDHLYEKAKADWESAPANKRGTPPVRPKRIKWTDGIEDAEKSQEPEIYPDIMELWEKEIGTLPVEEIEDIRHLQE